MQRDESDTVRRPALRIRRLTAVPPQILGEMGYEPHGGYLVSREAQGGRIPATFLSPWRFNLGVMDKYGRNYRYHMQQVARQIAKHARKFPQLRLRTHWEGRVPENRLTDLSSVLIALDVDWSRAGAGVDDGLHSDQEDEKYTIAAIQQAYYHLMTEYDDKWASRIIDEILKRERHKYVSKKALHKLVAIYDWLLEDFVESYNLTGPPFPANVEGAGALWAQYISSARPKMALAWSLHVYDLIRSWITGVAIRDFTEVTGHPRLAHAPYMASRSVDRVYESGSVEDKVSDIVLAMTGRFLTSGITTPELVENLELPPPIAPHIYRALAHLANPYEFSLRAEFSSTSSVPDALTAEGSPTRMDEGVLRQVWKHRAVGPLLRRIYNVYEVLIFYYPNTSPLAVVLETVSKTPRLGWVNTKEVSALVDAFLDEVELVESFDASVASQTRSKRMRDDPETSLLRGYLAPQLEHMAVAWATTVYDGLRMAIPHAPGQEFTTAEAQLDESASGDIPLYLAARLAEIRHVRSVGGETGGEPPHRRAAITVSAAIELQGYLLIVAPMIPKTIHDEGLSRMGTRTMRWFPQYLEVLRLLRVAREEVVAGHPRLQSDSLAPVFHGMKESLRILDTRLAPLESGFFYHVIHKNWILEVEGSIGDEDGDALTLENATEYVHSYRAGLRSAEAVLRFNAWRTAAAIVRVACGGVRATGASPWHHDRRNNPIEPSNYLDASSLAVAAYLALWLASPRREIFDSAYGGSGLRLERERHTQLAGLFNHKDNTVTLERFHHYILAPLTAWLNVVKRGDVARDRVPDNHSLRPTATLGLARPTTTAGFVEMMERALRTIQLGQMTEGEIADAFSIPTLAYVYDLRPTNLDVLNALMVDGIVTPGEEDAVRWPIIPGSDDETERDDHVTADHVLRTVYQPLLGKVTTYFGDIRETYVHGNLQRAKDVGKVVKKKDDFVTALLEVIPADVETATIHDVVATKAERGHKLRKASGLSVLAVIREAVLKEVVGSGYEYDKLFRAHTTAWTIMLFKYLVAVSRTWARSQTYSLSTQHLVSEITKATRKTAAIPQNPRVMYTASVNLRLAHHGLMLLSVLSGVQPPPREIRRWNNAMKVVWRDTTTHLQQPATAAWIVLYRKEVRVATPFRLLPALLGVVHHMTARLESYLALGAAEGWKLRHVYQDPPTATDRNVHAAVGQVADLIEATQLGDPLEYGFVELVVYPLWVASGERRQGRVGAARLEADKEFRTQCWVLAAALVRIASGKAHRMPTGVHHVISLVELDSVGPHTTAAPTARLWPRELALAALVALGLYEYMGPERLQTRGDEPTTGVEGLYGVFTPNFLRYYDHVFRWPLERERQRRTADIKAYRPPGDGDGDGDDDDEMQT